MVRAYDISIEQGAALAWMYRQLLETRSFASLDSRLTIHDTALDA
jgi:hypothetical protein